MDNELSEFAWLSPWKGEGQTCPEPPDGDQRRSQMGSPSDTIRHVLLCLQGFFVLIAWFLFLCTQRDSTFKTQPPRRSWPATNGGAPRSQGSCVLLPPGSAPLPRHGSPELSPWAALLLTFPAQPQTLCIARPSSPALLAVLPVPGWGASTPASGG